MSRPCRPSARGDGSAGAEAREGRRPVRAWRLLRGGVLALALIACKEEEPAGKPPGQSAATVGSGPGPSAATTGAGSGDGGADGSTASGAGGLPPLPDPDDCACLAATPEEVCRTCVDETRTGSCEDAYDACEAIGERYCDLVVECVALCPTPDAYCVDTCLGADDSQRDVVEAFMACACGRCSDSCGEGSCS